jgi:hypothetical protein
MYTEKILPTDNFGFQVAGAQHMHLFLRFICITLPLWSSYSTLYRSSSIPSFKLIVSFIIEYYETKTVDTASYIRPTEKRMLYKRNFSALQSE